MKLAICYYSRHHENTLKLLKAMAQERETDLIDVTKHIPARLEAYDAVGFASGIYYGKFHDSVVDFARQYLPEGKDVFFVYTSGSAKAHGTGALTEALVRKKARILGEYGCRGFDTFGPFKLVGGIAKGRPNAEDLAEAQSFYRGLFETAK